MSSARVKGRMASPPKMKSAISVRMSVSEVVMLRPSVWMMLWLTMSVERLAHVAGPVLAHAVEDDDRVVHGEADDREHGRHEQGVDLEADERAQDREDADDDDDVVDERDDRGDAHAHVAEAVADPGHDAQRGEDDEQERLLHELGADDRTDGVLLAHLVDGAEALLQGRGQGAELTLGGDATPVPAVVAEASG